MIHRCSADHLDADQPHAAIGEIHDLQGARVLDDAMDVVRDQLLGADQHVDGDVVVIEQLPLAHVLLCAHARDLGGRTVHRVGDLAGDDVRLVRIGSRDQHVGIFRACTAQHLRV